MTTIWLFVCVWKGHQKRLKWNVDEHELPFNPSALRLQWGDATVSSRLCQLDLEETASRLQGMLRHATSFEQSVNQSVIKVSHQSCASYSACTEAVVSHLDDTPTECKVNWVTKITISKFNTDPNPKFCRPVVGRSDDCTLRKRFRVLNIFRQGK